jgi:hypothetical protein
MRPLSIYCFLRFLVFFVCTGFFSEKKVKYRFCKCFGLDSCLFKGLANGLKQSLKSLNQ